MKIDISDSSVARIPGTGNKCYIAQYIHLLGTIVTYVITGWQGRNGPERNQQ